MAGAVDRAMANAVAEARAEVRRCAKCGAPTLVCVHAWQHSVNGISGNTVIRECQCQSCGATVTLQPRIKIWPLWLMAVLLLPSVIGSLAPGIMAFRRGRAWKKSPIVPGAPMPAMRYKHGPGNRRCECGDVLLLKSITRNTHNGIPVGTEYVYQCARCDKQVTLESALGIILNFLFGALLGLCGYWMLVGLTDPWWRWGGGIVVSLLGLALVGQGISRIAAVVRHPELPSNLI
jgi:hypothetical protein